MTFGKKDPKYQEKTSIPPREPKTIEKQVKELEGKSFAQEIEQDKNRSAVLIGRGEKAGEDKTNPHSMQEVESVGVYKRALILLGSSGLEVNSEKQGNKKASENNLPVSSYLSHGSRTVIQIPPGSDDKLIKWLTSGDPTKDGRSLAQTPEQAMKEGKYVYNRSAATHDVSIDKDGKVKEEKGFTIGLKSFLNNKVLGQETKHFGVDLAVDSEYKGKDASGKEVKRPDGDHGHLYIHYVPATKDKPGSIMFGMEGAAPYSSKHSKTGASDPISPTGCSKFDDLDIKKQFAGEKEYEETIVPKKYNGLYANLDENKINAITQIDDKKFSIELAEAKPSQSPEEFVKMEKFHETPQLVNTKHPEKKDLKKPTMWQNFVNKITFGKAYKDEINEYKKESKLQKVQNKISVNDEQRVSKAEVVPKEPEVSKPIEIKQESVKPGTVQTNDKELEKMKERLSKPPPIPPKPKHLTELVRKHRQQLQKRNAKGGGMEI